MHQVTNKRPSLYPPVTQLLSDENFYFIKETGYSNLRPVFQRQEFYTHTHCIFTRVPKLLKCLYSWIINQLKKIIFFLDNKIKLAIMGTCVTKQGNSSNIQWETCLKLQSVCSLLKSIFYILIWATAAIFLLSHEVK